MTNMCSRNEQWCPGNIFMQCVRNGRHFRSCGHGYWIPSNGNTYLSNNLHDFGTEEKKKETLSSQNRRMDLGKHLNVMPIKQVTVVSSSFL